MKRVTATGRSVEDAVTSALVRLGVTRSEATIRVISEPVKGFLGLIGNKDAQVEVSVNLTPEEAAREFLADLMEHMGVDAKVRGRDSLESDEEYFLDIACSDDDLPLVIGRHGSTLDSIQYLVNAIANRGVQKYMRYHVDAGDYRRRRKESLCQMADRAADRATKMRRPVALEPMSAGDRKVIHSHLQERSDVTTSSEGTEPNRKVVVLPMGQTASSGNAGKRIRSQSRMDDGQRLGSRRVRTDRH